MAEPAPDPEPIPLADAQPEAFDHAAALAFAATDDERVALAAGWVLQAFDASYFDSRRITVAAQRAFESRDPGRSLALSRRRLSNYSRKVHALGPRLVGAFPALAANEELWARVETQYLADTADRYEADYAVAFLHSVRRKVYQDEWKPVDYGFGAAAPRGDVFRPEICRRFLGGVALRSATVRDILAIPDFACPYQDLDEDAYLVAERVNAELGLGRRDARPPPLTAVEMVAAGFFRNRGCYLVGRLVMASGNHRPLVIALLNDGDGIYVDAVLLTEADTHNIFSSTLANFHVPNPHYHELARFLHGIMPKRALGLHYSTIGYNHVGKVAVMDEVRGPLAGPGEVLDTAVGFRGTVAIGFSSSSNDYVLKVIRDEPTEGYKWGTFEGVPRVLDKYRRVHEINRTGSMLDNIIYYNVTLERAWFAPALLDELLEAAAGAVSLVGDQVMFRHLIVQAKMVPLPVFLETAADGDAASAITSLGHCIKNNAAANVFNKDLDARNYGVGDFLKVYLYDYGALEPFTEVKIRTNTDRIDGDEDVPDWFFEDGVVFLPEEAETGLRIPNRELSRHFRAVHGDLLTTAYWDGVQHQLQEGEVPAIRIYPDECCLQRQVGRLGTYY